MKKTTLILFYIINICTHSFIYAQTDIDAECNQFSNLNEGIPDDKCRIIGTTSQYPLYSVGYSFNNDQNFGLFRDEDNDKDWVATMRNDRAFLDLPSKKRNSGQKITQSSILKFNGHEVWRGGDIQETTSNGYCPYYSHRFTLQGEFQSFVNVNPGGTLHVVT